ncbi:MAG TPA: serine hydrolase [Thermoanaerobaculia bacterium]|jgi:CubicO group peptidase (beta-lactamase class C family)|nr:serine hydrolase [Thermoanaerobaculia bacterium]
MRFAARFGLCAATVFGSALGLAAQSEPLKTAVSRSQLSSTLDRVIPRLMKDGDVPGVSLAVVKDGRVLWRHDYGVKDAKTGAPIDEDTIFEAGSLSKPVFAYAVLKLVDAGIIKLDTPIVKYLPGDYSDDPRLALITPRHVLSHTTGFPNWREGRDLTIAFTPGEKFSYSGEGFVYLQKAVEHVTGQTLGAVMKRLVFVPLQMKSSAYSWEDRFESRKATGHDGLGEPQGMNRPAEALSAATLQTTTQDYARFLIAVLDGTGLKRKVREEMFRPQIRLDEGCTTNCIDRKSTGRLSKELAWGLGWGLQETADGLSIWHWGDNGNFHCEVVGYPRQRFGAVVFTNGEDGHGIIPDIVQAAVGGQQPAFAWLAYERWDSPARTFLKDVLARGDAAIADYRAHRTQAGATTLTQQQVNRVGYGLLEKKRTKDAVAVFEMNAADFPTSWNVYDSLAEAYADDGQREKAIVSYEKSITLNPENGNGIEQLKKLRAGGAAP